MEEKKQNKKNILARVAIASGVFFSWLFLFSGTAFASNIYLKSQSQVSAGSNFDLTVFIDTQKQSVNVARANISYDPQYLDVISAKVGSTFYLNSPGMPSRERGFVSFEAGVPNPGYNGNSGSLGVITFRALKQGKTTINVTGGKALLNDGQGTDSFSGASGVSLEITPPPTDSPVVSSSSHPDQSLWYKRNDVTVSWTQPLNAYAYTFSFDQNPNGTPDPKTAVTDITSKTYHNVDDGIWYFHIQSRQQPDNSPWSPSAHYKIQVDTIPPETFDIKVKGVKSLASVPSSPTINFDAPDKTSGIDHYEVYLDGNMVEGRASSPYTFEELSALPHTIKVAAYDKAGNMRAVELPIIVAASAYSFQSSMKSSLNLLFALNGFILILLAILIFSVLRRRGRSHLSKVASDQAGMITLDLETRMDQLRRAADEQMAGIEPSADRDALRKEINEKIIDAEAELEDSVAKFKEDKNASK